MGFSYFNLRYFNLRVGVLLMSCVFERESLRVRGLLSQTATLVLPVLREVKLEGFDYYSQVKGFLWVVYCLDCFAVHVFALLSLHLFMYGCNLFMWKSTRINCNFIFEFQLSTALKYRDAFLICTTFMTAVVGAMVVHLISRANNFLPSQVDAIPGIFLLLSIALLICPLDIFYRPTRYCFIRVIRNIVCSPLYKDPELVAASSDPEVMAALQDGFIPICEEHSSSRL